jgi:hypothetical protein
VAVDPATSTFSFDDYDITANSSSTATASVTALNEAGDPLANKTVTLAIETIAVSAANSLVTCTPSEIDDDGVDSVTISVQVKDASGRGIPDIPASDIVLASTGTGNTITQPTGSTNQLGIISGSMVSTVPEAKTLSATVRGTAITDTASVTVSGAPAPATFPNEPVGYASIADWDNEATLDTADFTTEGSPNPTGGGTTTRVATIPWTPTYGGPAGIYKHQAGGSAGGYGSGRTWHEFAANKDALYILIETYIVSPHALSDNSNKFMDINWGDGASGKQMLLSGRMGMDGGAPRAGDGKWRIAPESGFASGSEIFNGTIDIAFGVAQIHEIVVINNSGAGVADGIVRHWVDGVLSVEQTDLEMPLGELITSAYTEGVNNGNHSPTASDPRLVASPDGTANDSDWYMSRFYLSAPV